MAKKPTLHGPIVDDKQQAEGALAEMAAVERKIALAKLEMQEEIDAAKTRAQDVITPLAARYKELETALKKWATMNKSVLFAERKSLDLTFGVIGFTAGTKIQQMNGVNEAETLEKLKRLGLTTAIRIIEEVNKDAMSAWPEERLALVGCVRRTSDNWFCKPAQEKVKQ
jgi:phage host-nuclease inhibitor protein Gam